jgi:hypothetical protein
MPDGRLRPQLSCRASAFGNPMKRPALGSAMRYVLVLLVAVTMASGAAAGVTISLAPAYAVDNAKGY